MLAFVSTVNTIKLFTTRPLLIDTLILIGGCSHASALLNLLCALSHIQDIKTLNKNMPVSNACIIKTTFSQLLD